MDTKSSFLGFCIKDRILTLFSPNIAVIFAKTPGFSFTEILK